MSTVSCFLFLGKIWDLLWDVLAGKPVNPIMKHLKNLDLSFPIDEFHH